MSESIVTAADATAVAGRTQASGPTDAARTALLTGWGRTAPSLARVTSPGSAQEVADAVRSAGSGVGAGRGVLARGRGRCYGDAAQSAGGLVLCTDRLAAIDLDAQAGLLVAGAGASLDEILQVTVPRGWFVPVTPGTRFVSLGGAVAADVHGKNHHVDGTIGAHLAWIELIDGSGALRRLSPDDHPNDHQDGHPDGDPDGDPAGFWATVGGMGLTGVITRVALRLRPVTSAWMSVETVRAGDLTALLDTLREHDQRYRYTVAWIDVLATGRSLGRGVITSGDHAPAEAVRANRPDDPLAYHPRVRLAAPATPIGLVTPATARAFNELWFRKAPAAGRIGLQRLEGFFHPLDGVRGWNRLYGRAGFLQYQFVVPDDRADLIERALNAIQDAGSPAFLAVLKRFGAANRAPLSFPRPGWTLAMDIPAAGGQRLARTLDQLDRWVADAGGAVYLAKDSRLRPELLAAMYPRLAQWRHQRDRLDPEHRFGSDLSRRIQL
jgi:decaprenylphospho-beta-D-ribofuranose 2-oxidase